MAVEQQAAAGAKKVTVNITSVQAANDGTPDPGGGRRPVQAGGARLGGVRAGWAAGSQGRTLTVSYNVA